MAVIEILSLLLSAYAVVMWSVTGRKLYLSIWFYTVPMLGMVFCKASDNPLNGLLVLIGAGAVFIVIYAMHGLKLWNIGNRKKSTLLKWITGIINIIVSMYFFVQCFLMGYMPYLSQFSNGIYLCFAVALCAAFVANKALQTAIDRYFSKAEKFIIIKCSPYRGRNFFKMRIKGIKGIQNGKTYVFRTTQKAFRLLKGEKSLIMESRIGVLGGIYVSKNDIYNGYSRQIRRINRILIRRGVFSVLVVLLVILFIYRVVLGMSFESIFGTVVNGILK